MSMRTKLLIGSALLLALPLMAIAAQDGSKPPMPPAPPMEMMQKMMSETDTNHDGLVSKDEHRAMADKHFDEADANHDGKLSPDEMQLAHRQRREMRIEMRDDHHKEMMEMRFNDDDTNKDSKISFDEFTKAHKEHFDMVDANHDGVIDKTEMKKPAVKTTIIKHDGEAKGQMIEQHMEKRIEMHLGALDDNHDGKVSIAEFNKGQKMHFDTMDANHDGALDRSEMPKPMMGHGPDGHRGSTGAHHKMMSGDGDMNVECKIIEEKSATESK